MTAIAPTVAKSRSRRETALRAHRGPEDEHDVAGIMDSYAPGATVVLNGTTFDSPDAIRVLHEQLGFSEGGALSALAVEEHRLSHTDDEVVLEGVLTGVHTGPFLGCDPSGRQVRLHYCVLYRFDPQGKLVQERAYIDTLPLVLAATR